MSAGRPNVGLMLKREKECASWSEGEGERERDRGKMSVEQKKAVKT